MKIALLRLVVLSFLVSASLSSWAQPKAAPPASPVTPPWDLSRASVDGLTLIGAFYNKMSRAESFRGRLVGVSTYVKDGKVTSTRTYQLESSWIDDGEREGSFSKSLLKSTLTVVENGVTTVSKFTNVQDGIKSYSFDETKSIWSESTQKMSDTAHLLGITRQTWVHALALFGAGSEFKTERKIVDGKELFVVKNNSVGTGTGRQYTFNADNGNLLSRTQVNEDNTTEYRWLQPEFDVPLDDSIFQWKMPEGAKQVAPETMGLKQG